MKGLRYGWLIMCCIVIIGMLAYLLGKKDAKQSIDKLLLNQVLIRDIAELSATEVQGSATIKTTNIKNNGTVSDNLKKLFTERTLNLSVPYIAKYGVDLSTQQISIEQKNKTVYIVMPPPQLLSLELRLDRSDAMARRGFLQSATDEDFHQLQSTLYASTKDTLQNYPSYIARAKENIRKIIANYYAPLEYKVDLTFKDELKSRVNDDPG